MPGSDARNFEAVLSEELVEIANARKVRASKQRATGNQRLNTSGAYKRAHHADLVGLAFSGGGIRSATFNLGVLQGLAAKRLLPVFDYLSTVSGGGYIGSWLVAWIRRRGWPEVQERLIPYRRGKDREEQPEIAFLRNYSNYMTPRKGLFSADTWTLVTTYMRNLLLNLLILMFALSAALVLPRLLILGHHEITLYVDLVSTKEVALAVLILLGIAIGFIRWNLSTLFESRAKQNHSSELDKPWQVFLFVVVPILVAAWLISVWLWTIRGAEVSEKWLDWSLATGAIYGALWVIAWLVGIAGNAGNQQVKQTTEAAKTGQSFVQRVPTRIKELASTIPEHLPDLGKQVRTNSFRDVLLSSVFAGLIGGPLLLTIAGMMTAWELAPGGEMHAASFGMSLIVLVFALVAVIHVGLAGRGFNEEAREWWSRVGAYLLIANTIIAALFAVALYSPLLIQLADRIWDWLNLTLGSGWLLTSIGGLLAAKNATNAKNGAPGWRKILMAVAPYVFILGLFVLLAGGLNVFLPPLVSVLEIQGLGKPGIGLPVIGTDAFTGYWSVVDQSMSILLLPCLILGAGLALLLSMRIGINHFSMHALYTNRLIRAYLGASNRNRDPQPFTGLDPTDNDTRMSHLCVDRQYLGPYPIINTALNLVRGKRLAWQQRKAASFVFTPKYCGYHYVPEDGEKVVSGLAQNAYVPSADYAADVSLGMAMGISGAAASPNMGYHTSVPLAFLMTVFNVRLGWWLGNSRHRATWRRREPRVGLFYLFCELLGATNDSRGYAYLSDGGHFENLGIYELVRRRCKYIVAFDAGEDREMKFEDLGNAVEKCRTDFGINIRIDLGRLRRDARTGLSGWHCVVGEIDYDMADKEADGKGTLVYIKSSLTGDEPADVRAYAASHPEFPHQATLDQWFDESQFESYRALGQHIIATVFEGLDAKDRPPQANTLFAALKKRWQPV